jgi:uncharacterized membrane protein YvbJ
MAFCTKCGKPIEEGVAFCGSCGVPVAGSAGTPVVPAVPSVPGKEDKLEGYWYAIVWCSLIIPYVGGLIIVILTSVLYYLWRKDFPKKAKAINRQGFLAFFVVPVLWLIFFLGLRGCGS